MSRYIDANPLYERTAEWEAQALHMVGIHIHDEDKTEWKKWSAILQERSAFKFDIADTPTADVRENVHASWVKESENCVMGEGYMWFCSRCDNRIYVDKNGKFPKFCDECGARMVSE